MIEHDVQRLEEVVVQRHELVGEQIDAERDVENRQGVQMMSVLDLVVAEIAARAFNPTWLSPT